MTVFLGIRSPTFATLITPKISPVAVILWAPVASIGVHDLVKSRIRMFAVLFDPPDGVLHLGQNLVTSFYFRYHNTPSIFF